ncbi:hypothetical protein ACHAWF_009476 [Thalassiosira exigua]
MMGSDASSTSFFTPASPRKSFTSCPTLTCSSSSRTPRTGPS